MPRTPSLEHAVLISTYEQNRFIKDHILKWNVLSLGPSTVWRRSAVWSQTKTFGMSRDHWRFLEQPYEHYCYKPAKPINVSHNVESKHPSAWTMTDHSKLQYGHIFPDTTDTNGCGHSQHNTAQCGIECFFLICLRKFQMYDETKADIFIWVDL